jgi:hypothetical protein
MALPARVESAAILETGVWIIDRFGEKPRGCGAARIELRVVNPCRDQWEDRASAGGLVQSARWTKAVSVVLGSPGRGRDGTRKNKLKLINKCAEAAGLDVYFGGNRKPIRKFRFVRISKGGPKEYLKSIGLPRRAGISVEAQIEGGTNGYGEANVRGAALVAMIGAWQAIEIPKAAALTCCTYGVDCSGTDLCCAGT